MYAKEDTFFENIQNRDAQYRIRHLKDLGTEVDEREWVHLPFIVLHSQFTSNVIVMFFNIIF